MKRIMVVIGGLLIGGFLIGSGVGSGSVSAEMPNLPRGSVVHSEDPLWHDSLESGWRESRRRGLPMVIFITSQRCHYCEAMKRDTWCDDQVRQQLANEFVAIRLTPDQNGSVLNRIAISTYPTTLIGIPQGKIIDHRVGYQPPRLMMQLLRTVKRTLPHQ